MAAANPVPLVAFLPPTKQSKEAKNVKNSEANVNAMILVWNDESLVS
ncbi:hypothetical protein DFA_06046 [Cavenderia fasciculata]|uniref:Uncharacterized protein n=1 Tax=Cavenderia fasciculata TaxID=261658 RepID=F4PJY4_CACFS|nr:uncharacterized protein DFA_06046 [Cavenderia fasciculata]EGG23908.1 hypothetical protein DFA_06046 [Cavenderia fasciculata]|eukprot:XP_004361759.1 hypothetical protein DFA_06046 [Cavenderia fasciculata]